MKNIGPAWQWAMAALFAAILAASAWLVLRAWACVWAGRACGYQ